MKEREEKKTKIFLFLCFFGFAPLHFIVLCIIIKPRSSSSFVVTSVFLKIVKKEKRETERRKDRKRSSFLFVVVVRQQKQKISPSPLFPPPQPLFGLLGQSINPTELPRPRRTVQKRPQIKPVVVRGIPFGVIRRRQGRRFVPVGRVRRPKGLDPGCDFCRA